ncbi:hypothetical protein EON65_00025 [archaeon]|nr:MAG: hypothetical protein EON65_00025 [archaeon]
MSSHDVKYCPTQIATNTLLLPLFIRVYVMATGMKEIVGFQLLRDECLRGSFQDVSQSNLLGNLQSSISPSCLDSNGLISHYTTQRGVGNMLSALSSNFSIEMWYRPQFNISENRFIVSLALPSLSRFGSCFSNLEILQSPSSSSALSSKKI